MTKPFARIRLNQAVSLAQLRQHWTYLNEKRTERGLKPYSYKFLSDIASDSNAVDGEAIAVSKSTVAAIFAGTYSADTAPAIRRRLLDCILVKAQDLGVAFPTHKKRTATTPTISIKRCSQEGYVDYRGNTYYLGPRFAGLICTVSPLRDKSKGIRATIAYDSRTAYPVDACNNQLGYQVAK